MVVATEKFADLARQAASQAGLPEARIVTVAHPVGGVARDGLEARADRVLEEVIARLLDG